MKILRVISSVNFAAGGPINGLINSYREFVSKNHRITVVVIYDLLDPWVKNLK